MMFEVGVLICETCGGALGISLSRLLRPGLKRVQAAQMDSHFLNAHFAKGRKGAVPPFGIDSGRIKIAKGYANNPILLFI
jgi:hypothetical protein